MKIDPSQSVTIEWRGRHTDQLQEGQNAPSRLLYEGSQDEDSFSYQPDYEYTT